MTKLQPLTGQEQFRTAEGGAGFNLLSFWRWALSGLSCNTTRGVVAEFIVAQAVGGATGVRDPWAAHDVTDAKGTRIEVKARANLQCWSGNPKSPPAFEFSATRPWSCELGRYTSKTPEHNADVYVAALLPTRDRAEVDPFNLDQWRFYVLPRSAVVKRSRWSLSQLRDHSVAPVHYGGLRVAVQQAALAGRPAPAAGR